MDYLAMGKNSDLDLRLDQALHRWLSFFLSLSLIGKKLKTTHRCYRKKLTWLRKIPHKHPGIAPF